MEEMMKKYLFAVAMLGLSSVGSKAVLVDPCQDCVDTKDHKLAVTECVNDFMLLDEQCTDLLKGGACKESCPQAPKYKVTKAL